MNDESAAHFPRAIQLDDSLAGHTFLLAKRLSQRGYNVVAIRLVTNVMSLHIGSDAIESIYARYNDIGPVLMHCLKTNSMTRTRSRMRWRTRSMR